MNPLENARDITSNKSIGEIIGKSWCKAMLIKLMNRGEGNKGKLIRREEKKEVEDERKLAISDF